MRFGADIEMGVGLPTTNTSVASTTFVVGFIEIKVLAANRVFDNNIVLRRVLARWGALSDHPIPAFKPHDTEKCALSRDMHRLLSLPGVRVDTRFIFRSGYSIFFFGYLLWALHLWLNPKGDDCCHWKD